MARKNVFSHMGDAIKRAFFGSSDETWQEPDAEAQHPSASVEDRWRTDLFETAEPMSTRGRRPSPKRWQPAQKTPPKAKTVQVKRAAGDTAPVVARIQVSPPPPGFSEAPKVESQYARANPKTAPIGDMVPVGRATTRVVGEFKRPDPWVDTGRALSLSEVGRTLTIRLGIDFGSGFSKLAVALNDEVYPVDWAGLHGGIDPYLLPGELSLVSDGELYVGRCLTGISTYDNLKLPFLSGPTPSDNDLIYATSYLAWVFKYARAWVYKYKASVLTNRKLVWVVNVGLPTETWGGTDNLIEKYKTMALAAWRVSQDDGPTESSVRTALNNKYQDASVGLESLSLIPEFVAQVAGYLESPQRVTGMHLLVDVGAGTLDVACFRVMRDNAAGVDRLPVFAASVRLQGTSFLMRRRLESIGKSDQLWNSALPTPSAHVFAAEYACATDQIDNVDGAFSRKVMSTISNVILQAKNLDPTADEFKPNETANLQVILSGGGASIEAYKSAVERACRSVVSDRYHWRALSRVVNLQLIRPMSDSTYSRVSVAVGLTRLVEDFQLIAPKEIPPLKIDHAPRQNRDDLWGG